MQTDFKFLEWPVYRDSKALFHGLLSVVRELPQEYQRDLGSQITRAGFSVILNIAEGSGKTSSKDFSHFLSISRGSLFEVLAALDILVDNKLLSRERFEVFYPQINDIAKQLGGFRKKLKNDSLS